MPRIEAKGVRWGGVLVAFWLGILLGGFPGHAAAQSRANPEHAKALRCGPNSLYLFAVLSGRTNLTVESLYDMPMGLEGVSLLSIYQQARKLDLDVELRRFSPQEIRALTPPAIVQITNFGAPSPLTRWHFDVLYRMSWNRAHLINSTTGEKYSVTREFLGEACTGAAMVRRGAGGGSFGAFDWTTALAWVAFVGFDAALAGYWLRRRHRPA